MIDHHADILKYSKSTKAAAVAALLKYCAKALKSRDSALVAVSDKDELKRIQAGFAKKKLGLSAEEAQAGIKAAATKMKGVRAKNRVTFYYLIAEATGTLNKLV